MSFITRNLRHEAAEEQKRRDAIPHFTKDKLANSPCAVPSLAEQQEIAEYLDKKCAEIDRLIAIKQQKIEKLNDYKKSLIYEYVTGKKQVS